MHHPLRSLVLPLVAAALVSPPLAAADTLLPSDAEAWETGEGVAAANAGPAEGGGETVRLTLDMGKERVNWTNARWAVVTYNLKPVDWSDADGLKVTATNDQPRDDVGVYLAVREADGSWYVHPWASDLTQNENTGVARWSDFSTAEYVAPLGGSHFDENDRLDPDAITAVAIGSINPLGVGEVSFTITGLEPVKLDEPKNRDEPITVEVTGKLLDINGTTAIPPGIFGGFNLKEITIGTPSVTIDGKSYPVEDGKITVDGTTHDVNKGKVKIDGKTYGVEGHTKPRTHLYRLAMDKTIDHGGGGGQVRIGDERVPMLINSVGDRTAPPVYLTNKNWESMYQAAGKQAGEMAKESEGKVYIEYWNEPYLNWANINRKAFNPDDYNLDEAKEGGPVVAKSTGETMPHLKWTRDPDAPAFKWYDNRQQFRRGRDEKGNVTMPYAMPYSGWNPPKWRAEAARLNPPDDVKDGETYEADGKTWTAFTPWHVYDETQFTYWSGQGLLKPYIEPAMAYGKALKEAGGDEVVYIVGWGNRPSEDHWAGWERLYKPTVDALADVIDGVNEHDYGGSPIKMAANHEFVTAYGQMKHDNWLYSFNTESGLSADPQAVGDAAGDVNAGGKAVADRAKFRWITAKILHTLEHTPDKTRAIAHFGIGGPWFSDEGEGVALTALKDLRGRLVQVKESDPDLYVVASIDGTDEDAPPDPEDPEGKQKELVVAMFNAGDRVKLVDIVQSAAPAETLFVGEMKMLKVRDDDGLVSEDTRGTLSEPKPTFGSAGTKGTPLQPGELSVTVFPLQGHLATGESQVLHRQSFGSTFLHEVKPAAPLTQTITIDPEHMEGQGGATRAWLRLVVERLGEGEGVAVVNGTQVPLPRAVTPENTPRLLVVPIDPAILKPGENTVEYRTATDHNAGYLLASNSITVERER